MNIEIINRDLLQRIRQIWESARFQAVRSVNSAHVCANWLIGQQIVEAEQGGADRAQYGVKLLETLSQQLSQEYGIGFSVSALRYMRLFYLGYPDLLPIHHAMRDELDKPSTTVVVELPVSPLTLPDTDWKPGRFHPGLSWTHYRALLKVDRPEARNFYEIETIKNGWSARQLERQINSLLFDRLLKSRDKAGLLALANEGLVVNQPADMIKDPYVLEFLDLPESERLVESQLEEALVNDPRLKHVGLCLDSTAVQHIFADVLLWLRGSTHQGVLTKRPYLSSPAEQVTL